MNTFLWILQGRLAVVFLGSGIAKSTMSRERLIATGQTGIALFPMPVVRVTAASELLAAAGLAAAVGDRRRRRGSRRRRPPACASSWWERRGRTRKLHEPQNVAANGLFFAAALAVAIGRLRRCSDRTAQAWVRRIIVPDGSRNAQSVTPHG